MSGSSPLRAERGIATWVSVNSGTNLDTGSERRMEPASTSIMIATPVTGLVIEAMGKIVSFRIGRPVSMSISPWVSKCAT